MASVELEEKKTNDQQIDYLNALMTLDTDSPYKKDLLNLFMSKDVHLGHQKSSCNPLMLKYLYGEHGDISVINLVSTMFLLKKTLNTLKEIFSTSNTRILFIGSKEQLIDIISESAERCGQYYVNHRWFGGTLTNWSTIQQSIKKMNTIEKKLENSDLSKKERQSDKRILTKLDRSLGGIRKMPGLPDMIFVTDTNREKCAILEAKKLGIKVIALLDSNSDPLGIDYPIPANDDSQESVKLICNLISDAILAGISIFVDKKQIQRKEREDSQRSYSRRRDIIRPEQQKENKDDQSESGHVSRSEGFNSDKRSNNDKTSNKNDYTKRYSKPIFNKDANNNTNTNI